VIDVLEVPLPARVRAVVSGGGRFHQLAAVLSDPARVSAPHPTTLMKITTRRGTSAVEGLNEAAAGQGGWGQGAQDQPAQSRRDRRPGN
jgi:hypothetical protein